MEYGKIRPGKRWYVVSLFILIAGISAFVVLLMNGISGMTSGSQRFVVPGTNDVTLPEAGKYVIYYEYNSVVDGKVYMTDGNLSGLKCTLKDKSSGQNIEIVTPSINSNYSFGGHAGVSVLEFTVPKAGTYELNAQYGEDGQDREIVLVINKGFVGKTVLAIILGAIVFLIALALSIAIFIVTIVKRTKAINNIRSFQV